LAEVVSNITGNALEHAAPGTRVVVTARAAESEAVVEIVNEGAPIPPDVLPVIFEPFRQAKPREGATTGNLGLGLYIAKQIVMSMGGTLDARSIDRTTTFVVRLPHTRPVPEGRRSEASSFSATPHHRDAPPPDSAAGDVLPS
jgi:signal transduction histidine kinase